MGIAIKDWNKDRIIYKVVPEEVPDEQLESFKTQLNDDREVNGWTKDRSIRKTGEVPYSVLYNYALSKGVPSTRIWDFFKADNCKEMKRFLNEFGMFRVGDKFYAKKGKL